MATTYSPNSEVTQRPIPPTMRAAVYRGINDVRVETVPVPSIGPGEVLIRVAACGICGTDLKKIHTGSHSAPRIFGHETAGTIAAVGDGIEDFAIGDRVMVFHHVPCGDCYYCRKKTFAQCPDYKHVGCTAGFEPAGGGFAEYVHVRDWIVRRGLIKIPDGIPFEQAAFVEPVNTCLKGVKSLALAPDETVLVIGQGPIGILLATLSARSGAKGSHLGLIRGAPRYRRYLRPASSHPRRKRGCRRCRMRRQRRSRRRRGHTCCRRQLH